MGLTIGAQRKGSKSPEPRAALSCSGRFLESQELRTALPMEYFPYSPLLCFREALCLRATVEELGPHNDFLSAQVTA
jgi:hypothetical protein